MKLSDKIYYLNKIMNGVDAFYEILLPKIFSFGHPLGTILGRAKYSDYFSISQNCTVGNNKGIYPVFEEFVTMFPGSKVIGKCSIGKNTLISANTYIKNQSIHADSIVFGSSPNLIIKVNNFSFLEGKWNLSV